MGDAAPLRIEAQQGGGGVLVYTARHRLLTALSLLLGGPALLGLAALAAYKLSVGDLTALVAVAILMALAAWAIASVGFGRRSFRLRIDADGIEVNGMRFAHREIDGIGVGGPFLPPHDTVSGPVPRNAAFGWHVYLWRRGTRIPVTVGMDEARARAVFAAVETLRARVRPTAPPPG